MSTRASVLFVDDEERIVNLLRIMFRSTYDVSVATSGPDAIKLMKSRKFHVVVSDQRMPGMSGIELLSHVAKESPNTVRMLLTGYSDLAAIVGSVNDGEVFRFLNKPWNQADIRQSMADAVEVAMADVEEVVYSLADVTLGKPSILVLDDSVSDLREVSRLLQQTYTVHGINSVQDAILKLNRHDDIAAIVCESSIAGQDVGELLHFVKRQFPAIMTVMLTRAADSEQVIRLINQARIFRFSNKPLRPAVLQLAVAAAVKEHQRCVQIKGYETRQRVAERPEPATPVFKSFLQSLKGLTGRWKLL
jgi:DNA-binding NtrC family response regulator